MEIAVHTHFPKQLKKCPPDIQSRFRVLYDTLEAASTLDEIPGLKKLAGFKDFYRIRLGNWRIGIRYEEGVLQLIHLMTIRPRGDIYKHFLPK